MFGSRSRHLVAIRGDTCSTVGTPYVFLSPSANSRCSFFANYRRRLVRQALKHGPGLGKMRSLFSQQPNSGLLAMSIKSDKWIRRRERREACA